MHPQFLIAGGGALFGLLLIAALLGRRDGVRRANRLLAASLACSVAYLVALMSFQVHASGGTTAASLLACAYLLSPPLLMGYVRVMIEPARRFQFKDGLHLLPIVGILLLLLVGSDGVTAESLERARGGWPPNRISLAGILIYAVQIGYFCYSLLLIGRHKTRLAGEYSYDEGMTLRWLGVLLGISLALSCLGLLIALARMLPGVELWPRSIYSMLTVIAVYYLIAYMGISQPAIFAEADSKDAADGIEQVTNEQSPAGKYETSSLTSEAAEQLWEALQLHMQRQQPFLEPQLRIAELASGVGMPAHHLSQTINRCTDQSFFEFVNGFRVDRAKALLEEGDRSVTAVGFDAGFNSESAFYRHFKKVTGLTPRQYRQQFGAKELV